MTLQLKKGNCIIISNPLKHEMVTEKIEITEKLEMLTEVFLNPLESVT